MVSHLERHLETIQTETLEEIEKRLPISLAILSEGRRTAYMGMLEAGRALYKAKHLIPVGAWLHWLEGQNISPRNAQRWMRLVSSDILTGEAIEELGGLNLTLEMLTWLEGQEGNLNRALENIDASERRMVKLKAKVQDKKRAKEEELV